MEYDHKSFGLGFIVAVVVMLLFYFIVSYSTAEPFKPHYFNSDQIEAQLQHQRTPGLHIANHSIYKPDQDCMCVTCLASKSTGSSFEDIVRTDPRSDGPSSFEQMGSQKVMPEKEKTCKQVSDDAVETMLSDFTY